MYATYLKTIQKFSNQTMLNSRTFPYTQLLINYTLGLCKPPVMGTNINFLSRLCFSLFQSEILLSIQCYFCWIYFVFNVNLS